MAPLNKNPEGLTSKRPCVWLWLGLSSALLLQKKKCLCCEKLAQLQRFSELRRRILWLHSIFSCGQRTAFSTKKVALNFSSARIFSFLVEKHCFMLSLHH